MSCKKKNLTFLPASLSFAVPDNIDNVNSMNQEPRKTIKKIVVAQKSTASHMFTSDSRKTNTTKTVSAKNIQFVIPVDDRFTWVLMRLNRILSFLICNSY